MMTEHHWYCFGKRRTVEITLDKVTAKSEFCEEVYKVKAYRHITGADKHFFIRTIYGSTLILPKEQIPDQYELKDLFNAMELETRFERPVI